METYNKLVSFEIHPSVQRIAIMNYLLNHRTHPSVEVVYSDLNEKLPTLSKTTVYNTLKLLAEHGAALMLTIDENKVCFDGDTSPHAHFICNKCGKIYDMPMPPTVENGTQMESNDHVITERHYYYKGICKNCL